MLVNEPMLTRLVRSIALLGTPDLQNEPGGQVDVRGFVYHIDFLHSSALPSTKRARLEIVLLQPFFDFWWGGFDRFFVGGTTDQKLSTSLKASVNADKWLSSTQWIDALAQARASGVTAFRAGNFTVAHKFWQDAEDLKMMTIHTQQGYRWMISRGGTAWGSRFEENCFHIHTNLATVLLRLADVSEDQNSRRDHLAAAHQQCIHGIDAAHMPNFTPSDVQLSKVHLRRAQALRMQCDVDADVSSVTAAREALRLAYNLNPGDPKIMEETALICALSAAGHSRV